MMNFARRVLPVLMLGLAACSPDQNTENPNMITEEGLTVLISAILDQEREKAIALLEEGADPNGRNMIGLEMTPLMAAASRDDVKMARLLIAKGADVDVPDKMGDPAINWAAYYGYEEFVKAMTDAGADATLVGHGNPRQIAKRMGYDGIVVHLTDYMGLTRALTNDEQAALAAIHAGDLNALATLLSSEGVTSATDPVGQPFIAVAARAGQADIISALVEAGADINQTDDIGFTPLMVAARDGRQDSVERLLAFGADVNHAGDDNALNLTALHLAALKGRIDVLTLLAEAGADLNALGRDGGTPFLWALYQGQEDAAIRLLELGTDVSLLPKGTDLRDAVQQLGMDKLAARLTDQG